MRTYRDLNYTPPNSTGGLPALELCRSWIQNCTENHDRCKGLHPGPGSPWWPTRLLYVGGLSESHLGVEDLSSLSIQLHVTQDKQLSGSYMTLSHCWGVSGEMLKLTMDTYEHRKKNGFSFAELPKTFQDVVRLSRFLGNDYIWIDSLCIIQHSKDDWIREGKMMASVYSHSKCNIAATASSGPTEGCFYPRNPTLVSPLKIGFRHIESHLFLDDKMWNKNVEEAPLNKRAWVMQERALAPRQIHCGREQLLWECHETTACETFPFVLEFPYEFMTDSSAYVPVTASHTSLIPRLSELNRLRLSRTGNDLVPNDSSLYTSLDQTKELTRGERIAHVRHDIYQDWTKIVQRYSQCALTHRTDKLIAIFGIASQIQDVLMDTYVAGLWQSQLPWQLLWRTRWNKWGGEPHGSAPAYHIGPSWSWTCLDTEVWWRRIVHADWESTSIMLMDIVHVSDGHTITGQNIPNSLRISHLSLRVSRLSLRCILYKIYVSEGQDPYILTSVQRHDGAGPTASGGSKIALPGHSTYMDSVESRNSWDQSYLLPVSVKFHPAGRLDGLFVSPCHERPRLYRRIGVLFSGAIDGCKDEFRQEIDSIADEDKVRITLI